MTPRHARHRARRLVAPLVVVLVVALGLGSQAWWTVDSGAGGRGAAAAGSVGPGSAPTVLLDGTSATLTWAAGTLASGDPAPGHLVRRYDADTLVEQTVLTACSGIVPGTSCTEAPVPAGRWVYTVTPRIGGWSGAESGRSAVVTVVGDDGDGPTGGTVEATGLTAGYSRTTTLTLVTSPGTDPAGIAPGSTLHRASAPLTDGTCGTFGTAVLVATDPGGAPTDTVADQSCHRYLLTVADTLGNTTTYTSGDVKVDTVPPFAPSLTFSGFSSTAWSGTGSTVHYRSAAPSGAVTLTATASDTASGIATYVFPTLGSGWTSTPGGTGVVTYRWTGTPAGPGTRTVTATDRAGNTSAPAPFTLVADDEAPEPGTIAYPDGVRSSTTVSVSFTTGTDAGSGIGSRVLQRSDTPLVGGLCSAPWSAWVTVPGGTDPASSPVADVVTSARCYQYRYVVTDRVGNQRVTTGPAIVRLRAPYPAVVMSTPGLLSYYEMDDGGEVTRDTFTSTAGATLESRSGETRATWLPHGILAPVPMVVTDAGRLRRDGVDSYASLYLVSGTPPTANYTVSADIHVRSTVPNDIVGVVGRVDPSVTMGTYYVARYETGPGRWYLFRVVDNVYTYLGDHAQTLTAGTSYRLSLEMVGSTIRLLVDGVARVAVTDTAPILGPGRAGLASGFAWDVPNTAPIVTTITDSTGMHLDNFAVTASPALSDSVGTNHGQYVNGPLLRQPGALTTGGGGAATFDGTDDHARLARQLHADFSIEFWFKGSSAGGESSDWEQNTGLLHASASWNNANDFGISVRADGAVVAGTSAASGKGNTSITSAAGYLDGRWHHVVFTRQKSGPITLYVDGTTSSGTGSTVDLTTATDINLARIQPNPDQPAAGINHFAGQLDEVALYTTVLSPATVQAHFAAR
ncbi:Laminin G sub domain 2 [Cellulomonas flavigena DSM 20109]|uniref:Laminin G sub domain 2 n=1 Tax=Cellulomonas flavigena (strain ATCC 482 / DSM 20109 / BCRC 11376 / JCM 18109 / NBRC 3775 / NCIMB 8073 / NRS 134) TaxID=446466 RepID=D5ULE1_CELFN|nr:LamG domain-containing protein [Cellulomonas flavigena]ADG73983.1 Laminin G sub domain 2 [Cellulomonas flavigena DSM 20109]